MYERASKIILVCGVTVVIVIAAIAVRRSENAASDDIENILFAAETAENDGQLAAAVKLLDRLPEQFEHPEIYAGWLRKAELQLSLGQASGSAETWQTILSKLRDDTGTRRRLSRLLAGCGQRYEAVLLLNRNLDSEDVDADDLICLARNGKQLFSKLKLQRMNELQPQDPLPVLGLISYAVQLRDNAAVRRLLNVFSGRFSRVQIQRWKQALLVSKDEVSEEKFVASERFTSLNHHPEDWQLASVWAQELPDSDLSQRCLVQAVTMDPWNTELVHALSEAIAVSDPDVSQALRVLWKTLTEIQNTASAISVARNDTGLMQQIAVLLDQIGRRKEAVQWAKVASRTNSQLQWTRELIRRSVDDGDVGSDSMRWIHPVERLSDSLKEKPDLETFERLGDITQAPSISNSKWAFREVARNVGLDFTYDNGNRSGQSGLRMHEWAGGGVGVLDFDGDSFPDLYLTQGENLTAAANSDQIFRNIQGERFVSATTRCRIHQTYFGQGIAVGDVNNDGFDDLCIANIGSNQLLINQGDGTFQQFFVSEQPVVKSSSSGQGVSKDSSGSTWTTGIAIADFNQDGVADIYEMNYLRGDNVFEQMCDHAGEQRICGPTDFEAESDRVFLSNGDSTFSDATSLISEHAADARGMGILVADLDDVSGNEIYIANDETANQLFRLTGSTATETGITSGVALNQFAQQQGSMGIACSDFNGNGLPDLLVTNYYSESNTLYSQIRPNVFVDASTPTDLSAPSFTMLGFGCQADDFDNDGDEDIVVANGHLDNFTHLGHPWQMRPQLFENDGSGRFSEVPFQNGFFATQQLGRSLATLDWNADGLRDFVVTALDFPVQLLENTTKTQQKSVRLQLVGTKSSRAAVGAVVRLRTDGLRQSRWLTAGDGYQCSNSKQIHLAVPASASSFSLSIQWPSGLSQEFDGLPVTGRFTVVEGSEKLWSQP